MPEYGWLQTARNWTRFGDRWGTRGGNPISGLLNAVVPVSVIERFRDEDEGGVRGITVVSPGFGTTLPVGVGDVEFPACCFAHLTSAWNIHSVNIAFDRATPLGGASGNQTNYQEIVGMYSPFAPYNPCANNTGGAVFRPGLIARTPFTFGGVFGLGGTNPALPIQPEGFVLCDSDTRMNGDISRWRGDVVGGIYITSTVGSEVRQVSDDFKLQNQIRFDPPVRVPIDHVIAFQRQNFPTGATLTLGQPFDLVVSLLYTEEPLRR